MGSALATVSEKSGSTVQENMEDVVVIVEEKKPDTTCWTRCKKLPLWLVKLKVSIFSC